MSSSAARSADPESLTAHIRQQLIRLHLTGRDATYAGTGLFEVAAVGPHAHCGFDSFTDTAS
ncbi:hypothetical protein [Rhodococcus sp. WMMA185]|uniref:hypothetical protein n=1 Tax=Rhodococcus sp. WMMA185 TaxID=679318 RepID=UPI000A7672E6|nr:hypothetical protein [Rhodococcus sp. WMMA185]